MHYETRVYTYPPMHTHAYTHTHTYIYIHISILDYKNIARHIAYTIALWPKFHDQILLQNDCDGLQSKSQEMSMWWDNSKLSTMFKTYHIFPSYEWMGVVCKSSLHIARIVHFEEFYSCKTDDSGDLLNAQSKN